MTHKLIKTENYLLVVDESEIKVHDYYFRYNKSVIRCTKIESVFNEAFNKNEVIIYSHGTGDPYQRSSDYLKKIIAHLPLNGSPILEGVDLLPSIEDDVYELAEQSWECCQTCTESDKYMYKNGYVHGYNNANSVRAFNIKELSQLMHDAYSLIKGFSMDEVWSEWDESVKQRVYDMLVKIQSLHQYPTEFETEDVLTPSQIFYPNDVPYSYPKTITTTQGVQWVGKYL